MHGVVVFLYLMGQYSTLIVGEREMICFIGPLITNTFGIIIGNSISSLVLLLMVELKTT